MSKTQTRLGLKRIPTVLSEYNAGPVQGIQVSNLMPSRTFEIHALEDAIFMKLVNIPKCFPSQH